jgi:hypothetical protein
MNTFFAARTTMSIFLKQQLVPSYSFSSSAIRILAKSIAMGISSAILTKIRAIYFLCCLPRTFAAWRAGNNKNMAPLYRDGSDMTISWARLHLDQPTKRLPQVIVGKLRVGESMLQDKHIQSENGSFVQVHRVSYEFRKLELS